MDVVIVTAFLCLLSHMSYSLDSNWISSIPGMNCSSYLNKQDGTAENSTTTTVRGSNKVL